MWPACAIGNGMDKLTFETALAELMAEYDKVAAQMRAIVEEPMWVNRTSADAQAVGAKMENLVGEIFRLKCVWAEARRTHENRLKP